ncbi:IS21 family transposase [Rhodanobacter umsongensis]|uniref:IS21 family transposase n=1 Tax=Rhodanobacter umsongensis TaxID=633153 RepID=A0ABW0JIT4_9GAMM
MRNVREVLRLAYEFKYSLREIARRTDVSRDSVSAYLARAKLANLTWPLPEDWDDAVLETHLFPEKRPDQARRKLAEPDWAYIEKELRRKGATLKQLHLEYLEEHPEGMAYSLFCQRHREYAKTLDRSMRQRYEGGDRVFVDFAGATVQIHDLKTGEKRSAQIFVGCLGASGYVYAEAIPSQKVEDWIAVNVRMFEFFGGVPRVVVCDNLKSAVVHADRYEPELHEAYASMARHYGTMIIPARARKPKDKPKAEGSVNHITRSILFPLRNIVFTSFDELNRAIQNHLKRVNDTKYQKLDVSRRELFETVDRPALHPLPTRHFEHEQYFKRRVGPDYHVEVHRHGYSVPHTLVGEEVEIVLTAAMVEVNHRNRRVASHIRSHVVGGFTTEPAHRDPKHAHLQDFSAEASLDWARSVHPDVAAFLATGLEKVADRQLRYRFCMGLKKMASSYETHRLALACGRAIRVKAYELRFLRNVLKANLEGVPDEPISPSKVSPIGDHENTRGPRYYSKQTP